MLRLDFQKPRRVSLRRHKKEPPRLQVKGYNSPASCKPQRLLLMVLYANLIQKSICPSKMQHNRNNSSVGLAIGRNAVFSCFAKLRGIRRQRCWRRAAAHLPCRSTAWLGCAMRSRHLAMAKCLQSNRSVSRAARLRPIKKDVPNGTSFFIGGAGRALVEPFAQGLLKQFCFALLAGFPVSTYIVIDQ